MQQAMAQGQQGTSGLAGGQSLQGSFSSVFARGGVDLAKQATGNRIEPYAKMSPAFAKGAASGTVQMVSSGPRGLTQRVKRIQKFVKDGALDPGVRKLAGEIISGVPEKDWEAEARAIMAWTRTNVRYTRDSAYADTYVAAPRTLFDKKPGKKSIADCLPGTTLLLTDDYQLVQLSDMKAGMRIWGLDKWSDVEAVWYKGILPVDVVHMNNGSSFKATSDHHVWVLHCDKHAVDRASGPCSCPSEDRKLVRMAVSDLVPGMVLPQPESIPFGTREFDPDRAWVEGLYASDGSGTATSFSIAGQDGCPKEATKHEIVRLCEKWGIRTRWHRKQVHVMDKAWAQRVAQMGHRAPQKHVLDIGLNEDAAKRLAIGILADSGANSSRGRTFTSTSRQLTVQLRVLLRMAGYAASWRYIENHGGLGKNPIYRLGIRVKPEVGGKNKLLRVKAVDHAVLSEPVYDLTTDDHMVYLPESDVVVSQCDDYAITMGALLGAIGHNPKLKVIAATNGDPGAQADWNHIYLLDCLPAGGAVAGTGGRCVPMDASVNKPFGWEAPKNRIYKQKVFDIK